MKATPRKAERSGEFPDSGTGRRGAEPGRSAAPRSDPASDGLVLRFRVSERMVHWAIAVPFMVCFATALVLVAFYNNHPQRGFRSVFSWAHRISGLLLIILPPLALFRGRHEQRIHLENIKQAWSWGLDDLKWLARSGLAALSSRISLPEQGKFNAAEKLNFMMVMATYPVFILTGVMIWLPGVAFFSWVLHFFLAVIATPLMLGHIFMATINPSTRIGLQGMFSGFVDRRWAKHHYRKWYRENFEREEAPARRRGIAPAALHQPARMRCRTCHAMLNYPSWERLLERIFEAHPLRCPHCKAEISLVSAIAEPQVAESILRHLELGRGAEPLGGEVFPAA